MPEDDEGQTGERDRNRLRGGTADADDHDGGGPVAAASTASHTPKQHCLGGDNKLKSLDVIHVIINIMMKNNKHEQGLLPRII